MRKNILIMFLLVAGISFGQDYPAIVKTYLSDNKKELFLEPEDFAEAAVSSVAYSASLKAHTVYVDQYFHGVKIFNSVSPFVIRDGNVQSAALSFYRNAGSLVNNPAPSVSSLAAISRAAAALGIPAPSGIKLLETHPGNSYLYSGGGISIHDIPVQLVYQPVEEGKSLRLAWDLSIYLPDASHYYSVRIDAKNGELLEVHDWVLSCNFGENHSGHFESILFSPLAGDAGVRFFNGNSPSYRVFPIPVEAPSFGEDALVSDPSDPIASPFGWHDTDGEPGHEYTTTRGNNVLAQEDHAGNNSAGEMADGGEEMIFDFPFELPRDPFDYTDASITNLFYMNNILHDVFYQYGFDEESGNFQANNYDRGGSEGDFVIADAQDGYGTNNANFATPPDGISPRMQMFLWSAPGQVVGSYVTVNNGSLAGTYYGLQAEFGPGLPADNPLTANLVLVESAGSNPSQGCETITNAAELSGNIALIERGDCAFVDKVQYAQDAGAVAVVMINNEPGDPVEMGGSSATITIPSLMVYQADGMLFADALENGETISISLFDDGSGSSPFRVDSALDNVIISHEYGHGISIRLTGGRYNVGCLFNQEQMGEGWSDYFGLMLTQKPGDAGEDGRGIGTYAIGEGTGGIGIRAKPYSTDFGLNNFTYNDIRTQYPPHGVGSVWATMLWEMTWAFIDQYGFDSDIYHGTGGNNMALQLVVDGLRLQSCSPGFVDGRDAILEADELANDGENKCLIWEAFAKRGLGYSASQGSSNSTADGTEAFDLPPECSLGTGDHHPEMKNFVIYPNPARGDFYIKARQDSGPVVVSIFDMNGRRIYKETMDLNSGGAVDASGIESGIYLIRIEGESHSQTSRLIVN